MDTGIVVKSKLIGLLVLVLVVFIVGCSNEDDNVGESEDDVSSNESNVKEEVEEGVEEDNKETEEEDVDDMKEDKDGLGLTVGQFESRFNEFIGEMGLDPFKLSLEVEVQEENEFDEIEYKFNDSILLTGVVYKDKGNIKKLDLIGGSFKDELLASEYMVLSSVILLTLHSDLVKEEAGVVLLKDLEYMESFNNIGSTVNNVLEGIEYKITSNENVGMWVSISKEDIE